MSGSLLSDFASAILKNDTIQVESMIENNSIDVNARLPSAGNPPALILAVQAGHCAIVAMLLNAGARIDDVDSTKQTACHAAVLRSRVDVVELLLAHRPDLNLADSHGRSAIVYAMSGVMPGNNRSRIAALLIDAGAPIKKLTPQDFCMLAITSTFAIDVLTRRGIVLSEVRSLDMRTPLHYAAMPGHNLAVLKRLVDCGVNLESRSGDLTCTHIAVLYSNVDALRCFIEAGADVNCVGAEGGTPLFNARGYDCLILLLAAGADVNWRDRSGATASHIASGNPQILHALLAAGADLDVSNRDLTSVRQKLELRGWVVDADRVEAARRDIARARLDFVRHRAWQVCIGLQSLELDALQMCEILLHACGPVAPLVSFHHWWAIATTIKHFK